ncbi:MAG: S41 family peptidase [Bacteroidota bacterium]|nr:S41 family peptidase [Bacteroidota bacterium]
MHPVIGIYNSREYYENQFTILINSLNDSLTEKQFRIKLKIFLDDLHCGHTEAIYSKAYGKEVNKLKLNYSPYIFIPVQNKVYVLSSINRKKDTLLPKGTEILKINGFAVDSMLKASRQMITVDGYNVTGKNHYLKSGFNGYYLGLFGRPDTFNVEYLKDKKIKTIKYAANKLKSIPAITLLRRDDSTFTTYKKAAIKYKYLDGEKKIMYLKISSFSRKRYKKAYRKVFRKLENNQSDNLIIDLRNNGGGSLGNSYRLLSYLLDTTKQQTLKTHVKKYPQKKYTSGNIWFSMMRTGFKYIAKKQTFGDTDSYTIKLKPNKKHHYSKKIMVLINGGSFSASCLVSAYLKDKNRATFIGEETSGALEGCNAGITPYYILPNTKLKIRVPAFRIQHDIYKQNTGHGIIPDYKIEYTINDIFAKKDLELQKVKELLNIK